MKYSDDIGQFVEASLSPSKVTKVFINEKEKSAVVIVPDYQLSLAIGKEGQNARLAARLTNWKIDIKPESDFTEEDERALLEKIASDKLAVEEEKASKELAEENPAEDMDEEVALESSEEAMEPADVEVAEEILSDGEVEETSGDQA